MAFRTTVILSALFCICPWRIAGQELYAVDGARGNPSTLYRLDPSTGAVLETVGPIGYDHVTGIAFHPTTGVLFGVTSGIDDPPLPNLLLTIDLATGQGTEVGDHGHQVPDIAFDGSGTLYAWSQLDNRGGFVVTEDLYTLNLQTAVAAKVGECGCSVASTGIAFSSDGTLFRKSFDDGAAAQLLHTMDPITGTTSTTVPLIDDDDTNFNFPSNVLAFDPSDVLYTVQRQGPNESWLGTIDPLTGELDFVGTIPVPHISAIAFRADLAPSPSIHLSINGDASDVVAVPPDLLTVTLDMETNGAVQPVDWYYAILVGENLFWFTPTGLTSTPGALLLGVAPIELNDVVIWNVPLPAGTVVTFVFALADGSELVALDFATAVVNP